MPAAQLQRLLEVMHRLRHECPWDAEQTHESLVGYLIEESLEVVEAIEDGSDAALVEAGLVHLKIGAVQGIGWKLLDRELHRLGRSREAAIGEPGALLLADRRRKQLSFGVVVERSHDVGLLVVDFFFLNEIEGQGRFYHLREFLRQAVGGYADNSVHTQR